MASEVRVDSMDQLMKQSLDYWWRKVRSSEIPCLFDSMTEFLDWSERAGFQYGMRLKRINPGLEYSPDNCRWEFPKEKKMGNDRVAWAVQWERFAAPLRRKYKADLEMLANPQKEPEPDPEPRPNVVEYFRYEHPDLEREGICFILEI